MSARKSTRTSRNTKVVPTSEETNKIPLDDLIPTVSLIDYTLNLMQGGAGRAKYRFEKFGEKKHIIYEDVLRIIEDYRSFMEAGYFMFLDERVINRHGLQDITSKILKKDAIDRILNGEADAVELFNACTVDQRHLIVGMLTRKLSRDENAVDLNVVNRLSTISGVNIQENARLMRENSAQDKKDGA